MSGAPVERPNAPTEDHNDEEMPRVQLGRKWILLGLVFVVALVAFLYYGLPQLAGLEDTWHRIEQGDPWWLALAAAFAIGSFAGYVVLFHGVYNDADAGVQLSLKESYQVTMAALAATRVFAAGGAGGIALTAWAMRRAGMDRRTVADRTITFLVLTYVIYTAALVVFGYGLRLGILEGRNPFALTVIPATFALVAMMITLLLALTPPDLQRRLTGYAERHGRFGRVTSKLATLPAAWSAGVRQAIAMVRRRNPAIIGSIAFWGLNVAVLWASFRAFGVAPPWAVLTMAYFVGMLGNLLPLPGGVGGVDGGMIGALIAFGVDGGLAVVAVLTYRAFAFWLPTIPGAIAFFQLQRTVARWREERRGERGRRAAAVARA